MPFSTRFKWIITALGTVAFVIVSINLERLAEAFGYDRALVVLVEHLPSWLTPVWEAVTSWAALFVASMILTSIASIYFYRLFSELSKLMRKAESPGDLAEQCTNLARALKGPEFMRDMRGNWPVYLQAELLMTAAAFERLVGIRPKISLIDIEQFASVADFLCVSAQALSANNIQRAKELAIAFDPGYPVIHQPQTIETEPPAKSLPG